MKMAAANNQVTMETNDHEETIDVTKNKQDGFHYELVEKLSRAQILIGIVSLVVGTLVVYFGSTIFCDTYCYWIAYSLVGSGVWCGIVFIATGIIGSCTAAKRSTYMIVALMVSGIISTLFAGTQVALGVVAAITDRNRFTVIVNRTDPYQGFNYYSMQTETSIPIPAFVLNIVLVLLGLVMAGLLVASTIATCVATCCGSKPKHAHASHFGAASGATNNQVMQMQPQQQFILSGGRIYYVPQHQDGDAQAKPQPLIPMPTNWRGPVQNQVIEQPSQTDLSTPVANSDSIPQANPSAASKLNPGATQQSSRYSTPQANSAPASQLNLDSTPQPNLDLVSQPNPDSTPQPNPVSASQPNPDSTPQPNEDSTPQPKPDSTPQPNPDSIPQPNPDSASQLNPDSAPQPNPGSAPQPNPDFAPQPNPDSVPQQNPSSTLEQNPDSTPQVNLDSTQKADPEPNTTTQETVQVHVHEL